jgi:hypothetical protein
MKETERKRSPNRGKPPMGECHGPEHLGHKSKVVSHYYIHLAVEDAAEFWKVAGLHEAAQDTMKVAPRFSQNPKRVKTNYRIIGIKHSFKTLYEKNSFV